VDFQVPIPFATHLGVVLEVWANGEAVLSYQDQPAHNNSFSVVHGGVSMTLMDVAMAHAARSVQQDMGCVTIEMKTSFMQAAKGRLTVRGLLLHRTATMAFTEARITDGDGRLCAMATGTFKYVKRLPVGGRQIHPDNPTGLSTD
jgi:uncharacterized protein (TIGR00369 family)